jgi:hypothetical protein
MLIDQLLKRITDLEKNQGSFLNAPMLSHAECQTDQVYIVTEDP